MTEIINKQPLVSVFIPYYNDEKFLKLAIDAVLDSSYQNFELILLNHATTDSCRDIARSYKDTRIIHIDMESNLGYGGGGLLVAEFLKKAKGKYVKFLCADDIIRKDGLEKLVNFMENNPQIDFAFGNIEYIDENGNDLHDNWFNEREAFSFGMSEEQCIYNYSFGLSFLPYVGSIIKKQVIDSIELNCTYVMMFDISLWLSLLCRGYKIGFLDEIVTNYRIHESQISSIQKEELALRLSHYEWGTIWKYFLQIDNVDMIKKIWPNGYFVEKLQDRKDIPFVVAYELLRNPNLIHVHLPIISFISTLVNDKETRGHLEETFGYGIKQLREDCASKNNKNKKSKKFNPIKHMKQKIFNTSARNLRIREISFLLVLRTLDFISLRDLRKRKKRKKYSL